MLMVQFNVQFVLVKVLASSFKVAHGLSKSPQPHSGVSDLKGRSCASAL